MFIEHSILKLFVPDDLIYLLGGPRTNELDNVLKLQLVDLP